MNFQAFLCSIASCVVLLNIAVSIFQTKFFSPWQLITTAKSFARYWQSYYFLPACWSSTHTSWSSYRYLLVNYLELLNFSCPEKCFISSWGRLLTTFPRISTTLIFLFWWVRTLVCSFLSQGLWLASRGGRQAVGLWRGGGSLWTSYPSCKFIYNLSST